MSNSIPTRGYPAFQEALKAFQTEYAEISQLKKILSQQPTDSELSSELTTKINTFVTDSWPGLRENMQREIDNVDNEGISNKHVRENVATKHLADCEKKITDLFFGATPINPSEGSSFTYKVKVQNPRPSAHLSPAPESLGGIKTINENYKLFIARYRELNAQGNTPVDEQTMKDLTLLLDTMQRAYPELLTNTIKGVAQGKIQEVSEKLKKLQKKTPESQQSSEAAAIFNEQLRLFNEIYRTLRQDKGAPIDPETLSQLGSITEHMKKALVELQEPRKKNAEKRLESISEKLDKLQKQGSQVNFSKPPKGDSDADDETPLDRKKFSRKNQASQSSEASKTFKENLKLFKAFYSELKDNQNVPIASETLEQLAIFKNNMEGALSQISGSGKGDADRKFTNISNQLKDLKEQGSQPSGKERPAKGEKGSGDKSEDSIPAYLRRLKPKAGLPPREVGADLPVGLHNSQNSCFLNVILQAIAHDIHLEEALIQEGKATDKEAPLLKFLQAYRTAQGGKKSTAENPDSKASLNEEMEVHLHLLSKGNLEFGKQEDVTFPFDLLFKEAQNPELLTTTMLDLKSGSSQDILGFHRLNLEADTGGCDTLEELLDAYCQLKGQTAQKPFLKSPELLLCALGRHTQKSGSCVAKFTLEKKTKKIPFASTIEDRVLSSIAGEPMTGFFISETKHYYFQACETGKEGKMTYWLSKKGESLVPIKREEFEIAQGTKKKQEIVVDKVTRLKAQTGKYTGDIAIPLRFSFKATYTLGAEKGKDYVLSCFIVHKGATKGAGHYVIYVLKSDGWWLVDDDRVRQVSEEDAEKAAKQAYCFIAHQVVKKSN